MFERYRSQYLLIERDVEKEKGKTCVWMVLSTGSNARLGEIKWFSRWRQYTFFPTPGTIFNTSCLQEIINFIVVHQNDRRNA